MTGTKHISGHQVMDSKVISHIPDKLHSKRFHPQRSRGRRPRVQMQAHSLAQNYCLGICYIQQIFGYKRGKTQ